MISVIIPMYNEEKGAKACLDTLDAYLKKNFSSYEIIAVNDGSNDNTAAVINKAAEGNPHIINAGYPQNRGKGGAVRCGIEASKGDIVVYTDCDLAYGTEIIGAMAEKLSCGGDILIGSRRLAEDGYLGYGPLRKLASKVYIRFVGALCGFSHSDSQCGIKCFKGEAARRIFSYCKVNSFAFDLEALMIAERMGMKVSEFPAKILNHNQQQSKVSLVKDTAKMLRDIAEIKKRLSKLDLTS